jgi:hypothetical protein
MTARMTFGVPRLAGAVAAGHRCTAGQAPAARCGKQSLDLRRRARVPGHSPRPRSRRLQLLIETNLMHDAQAVRSCSATGPEVVEPAPTQTWPLCMLSVSGLLSGNWGDRSAQVRFSLDLRFTPAGQWCSPGLVVASSQSGDGGVAGHGRAAASVGCDRLEAGPDFPGLALALVDPARPRASERLSGRSCH